MEKKVKNWLGWMLTIIYLAGVMVLIFCGKHMDTLNEIRFRNYFYSAATLAFIVAFAIIPHIFYLSLGKLLPNKQSVSKVVLKDIESRKTVLSNGSTSGLIKYFVTFELENGDRKVFNISKDQYYSVIEGEYGTLTYKEQGHHHYFVQFKK